MSEFEINVFTGNKNISKSTLLVSLSAKSPNRAYLNSGTYKYSNKNPTDRDEFDFSGTVRVGSMDTPISDGWFSVNSIDKQMVLKYEFTLTNGVRTVGEYDLAFQTVEKSR